MLQYRRALLFFFAVSGLIILGASLTGCAIAPGAYPVSSASISTDYELVDVSRAPESVLNEISISGVLNGRSSSKNTTYRISAGDHLSVTLWAVPEFAPSTAFGTTFAPMGRTVDLDGSIFLPYVGEIAVAGLTIPQARERIFSALRKTVKDPQFDIRPTGRAYLMGEFLQNRPMLINDTFTIADAISQASGVSQISSNGSIFLIRPRGNGEPIVYWINLNNPRSASLTTQILVRSQDIVYAGTSDLAKFNRVFSNILPAVSATRQVQVIDNSQRINNNF